ncbi:hypothetical protein DL766_003487 [Monosporascus sp. MC13-8B]|uniref:N-acetylmuramoyl-L-alanine amidase n=1 Tax=Monosporascus cannonballus TaxID=155416 RepID=A0ABY0HM94_9PEZI|nr:hypothetical protein DL762_000026 [Monosporascus cannonballus]RYP00709.1 hypothetical protein DL763_000589 [Monosporascus cannonballus]RYP33356.1 hypothetical protein DL766_003487 [Monosporascus sp. MC13-8B]
MQRRPLQPPGDSEQHNTTLHVGNGDLAFNVDNLGMQTIIPFNTLSSWGWHNDSLPENREKPSDYQGVQGAFDSDAVTFDIESSLASSVDLEVELDFSYPPKYNVTMSSDFEIFIGTYEFPLSHNPTLVIEPEELRRGTARIYHGLTRRPYFVNLRSPCASPLSLKRNEPQGSSKVKAHRYTLSTPEARQYGRRAKISFTAHISLDQEIPALPSTIRKRNSAGWNQRWSPTTVARTQNIGWEGARWPKMTELGAGGISLGETRAFSMWQQPHLLYLAKLAYQASPTRETLEGHYDLGPPTKGVTDNSDPLHTKSLAYEIAYWRWGLDTDTELKRLLGQPTPRSGPRSRRTCPPSPAAGDGMYMPWEGLNSSGWGGQEAQQGPPECDHVPGYLARYASGPSPPLYFHGAASSLYAIGYRVTGWGRCRGPRSGVP